MIFTPTAFMSGVYVGLSQKTAALRSALQRLTAGAVGRAGTGAAQLPGDVTLTWFDWVLPWALDAITK
jgi:hypothetical protein